MNGDVFQPGNVATQFQPSRPAPRPTLPRSTFSMAGFADTPLGRRATAQQPMFARAQARVASGEYDPYGSFRGTPATPQTTVTQRAQMGQPVSQAAMDAHLGSLMQRPLLPQADLRAQAQAFNRTEAAPGGWQKIAQQERGAGGFVGPPSPAQQRAQSVHDQGVAAYWNRTQGGPGPNAANANSLYARLMSGEQLHGDIGPARNLGEFQAQVQIGRDGNGIFGSPIQPTGREGGFSDEGILRLGDSPLVNAAGFRSVPPDNVREGAGRPDVATALRERGLIPAPVPPPSVSVAPRAFYRSEFQDPGQDIFDRQPDYTNIPSKGAHGVALNPAHAARIPSSDGGGVIAYGNRTVMRPQQAARPGGELLAAIHGGAVPGNAFSPAAMGLLPADFQQARREQAENHAAEVAYKQALAGHLNAQATNLAQLTPAQVAHMNSETEKNRAEVANLTPEDRKAYWAMIAAGRDHRDAMSTLGAAAGAGMLPPRAGAQGQPEPQQVAVVPPPPSAQPVVQPVGQPVANPVQPNPAAPPKPKSAPPAFESAEERRIPPPVDPWYVLGDAGHKDFFTNPLTGKPYNNLSDVLQRFRTSLPQFANPLEAAKSPLAQAIGNILERDPAMMQDYQKLVKELTYDPDATWRDRETLANKVEARKKDRSRLLDSALSGYFFTSPEQDLAKQRGNLDLLRAIMFGTIPQ